MHLLPGTKSQDLKSGVLYTPGSRCGHGELENRELPTPQHPR